MGPEGVAQDSAFEPRPDFKFGECGDEEFTYMQRNLDTINGQQSMHSMNGRDMPDQFNPAFPRLINPMHSFTFDYGELPLESLSWSNADSKMQPRSMQADIVNNRSTSVGDQSGQLTPPDDDMSRALIDSYYVRSTLPTVQVQGKKSEQARNAANKRHARAKKGRKNTIHKIESPDDGVGDKVEDKREHHREKNRLAAAKCRVKKKIDTENLEGSARAATARNNRLRVEVRDLRDLFSSLRNQALAHDLSQGCNCQAIHAYNMHQAQEPATIDLMPGVPSSSRRSIDSRSPSAVGATSRTQPFSRERPRFAWPQERSQSLASPMEILPSNPADGLVRHELTTDDDDGIVEGGGGIEADRDERNQSRGSRHDLGHDHVMHERVKSG